MVPFKLAKMKCAEAPSPPFASTGNDEVLVLLTWPVGPWGPVAVVGIAMLPVGGLTAVTLVTFVLSVTAKRVAVLVPWFEVQKGLVVVCETPQGLTELGVGDRGQTRDVRNQIDLNVGSGFGSPGAQTRAQR